MTAMQVRIGFALELVSILSATTQGVNQCQVGKRVHNRVIESTERCADDSGWSELKKIRTIPRQKLKSTYSQRSAIYLQAGAEYVKQVSSALKNGINSLKLVSLALTSEGLCLVDVAFALLKGQYIYIPEQMQP
ncbi:hypothetical protein OROMI_013415 [Orobanche minor]